MSYVLVPGLPLCFRQWVRTACISNRSEASRSVFRSWASRHASTDTASLASDPAVGPSTVVGGCQAASDVATTSCQGSHSDAQPGHEAAGGAGVSFAGRGGGRRALPAQACQAGPSKAPSGAHEVHRLIRACTHTASWGRLIRLFHKLKTGALPQDDHTYEALLQAFQSGALWGHAVLVLEELAQQPPSQAVGGALAERFHEHLEACIRATHSHRAAWEDLLEAVQSMGRHSVAPRPEAYRAVLHSVEQAQQWAEVCAVLQEMDQRQVSLDEQAAKRIIHALCEVADPAARTLCRQAALHCYDGYMRGDGSHGFSTRRPLHLTSSSFQALVEHCSDERADWWAVIRLHNAMKALQVLPRTHRVWNLLLHARLEVVSPRHPALWPSALATYRHMRHHQVPVAAAAYNSLLAKVHISKCYKNWKAAAEIYEDMRAQGLHPDDQAATGLASLCYSAGEWERVLNIYNDLKGRGSVPCSRVFYQQVIPAWEHHHGESAVAVVREMEAAGVEPDIAIYNCLLSGMAKRGDWKGTFSLWEEILKHPRVEPDVISYSSAIQLCAKAGELGQATELYKDMLGRGIEPDTIVYTCLIAACAATKPEPKTELALVVYEDMKRGGVQPDQLLFDTLIAACEKAGQWQHALALADDMQAHGFAPSLWTYSALMRACSRAGEWQRTFDLFTDMKQRGHAPNIYHYGCIITTCKYGPGRTQAIRAFHEMLESGCTPTAYTYALLMQVCTTELLQDNFSPDEEAGLRDALELYSLMGRQQVVPNEAVFHHLIEGLARAHRWRDVVHLFENSCRHRCLLDRPARRKVALAMQHLGMDQAVAVLDMMERDTAMGIWSEDSWDALLKEYSNDPWDMNDSVLYHRQHSDGENDLQDHLRRTGSQTSIPRNHSEGGDGHQDRGHDVDRHSGNHEIGSCRSEGTTSSAPGLDQYTQAGHIDEDHNSRGTSSVKEAWAKWRAGIGNVSEHATNEHERSHK